MNATKKISILQRAIEHVVDAQHVAEAKLDDTLGIYYNDGVQLEIVQELEVLITEINCWVIELQFQEHINE